MAIYKHSKKAGNLADVWKHFVLLTVLEEMIPPTGLGPFLYRETHAGDGGFLLGRLGEWRRGIGHILPVSEELATHPYFRLVGDCSQPGKIYPASWQLAVRLFEEHRVPYRASLYDISRSVQQRARTGTSAGYRAFDVEFHAGDGYLGLERSPRADLTWVDPPYRPAQRDWLRGRSAATLLSARGESYLLCYPIFWPAHPQRLVEAAAAPAYEAQWSAMGSSPTQTLKGCGILAGGRAASILSGARDRLESVAALFDGRLFVRRGS